MRKRRPIFNLPNSLTLSRFFFAPIMLFLLLRLENPANNPDAWKITAAACAVLAVALLTDLFDGLLARTRGEVTNFGKIMDPVADSTFFMTLLFGLSACDRFGPSVSLWFPVLVLYREIAIHIFRRYAALKGNAVPAKRSGKIKMFSQSFLTAAFFLLTLIRDWQGTASGVSEELLRSLVFWLALFTVGVNYWSLIEYSRDVPELIAEYTGQADGQPGPEGIPPSAAGDGSPGRG
ncbi:MAG: CDP-alcohol phosphatidyltransferase family protein [Planctomycetota bacterium]|jgi:CDP-diacylglycerol--glycerol-3-phosphate 3-phosphatidyltransferase|nr:CDP-alcohol phosphatidyltransferase family protein [Planctomycetota bacterium]